MSIEEIFEIQKFTTLCRDNYELIIESFPWASITPTLQKILAHSAQLIDEYNCGRGMKYFSEDGLEDCHKYVRRHREQLARKTSFEDNIKDVYIRLLAQSEVFSFPKEKSLAQKEVNLLNKLPTMTNCNLII